ncbi:beta-ketoacyl-[acyl-carrier-protein] synthase family protein [Desulfocastanea catecholica]
MTDKPVYIRGTGIISSMGSGLTATENSLRGNRSAIGPLTLFPLLHGAPLPVGQVGDLGRSSQLGELGDSATVPRTHLLASIAARQAMDGVNCPPDAIILGTTTGGILTTEQLLRSNNQQKERYRHHGLNTVADYLALQLNCTGPTLVVSTACSSGAVALALALRMLRRGQVETVLAGGVDSLSRLTYFGFHSLQLVDQAGCRPLDLNRRGMAVAEGAGMLLLTTQKTDTCFAELLGAGLSCDAYHPAAPHPEGEGAFMAMQQALTDAGLCPDDIDYINLHGTGTPDNDLAESKAVRRLFSLPPPLSSIKGASGHSLAAAGAVEAVVATMTIAHGLLPANTGLQTVDPALGLQPLTRPIELPARAVLSNSFGFGGNNGSLIIGAVDTFQQAPARQPVVRLAIQGYSCLTGAGDSAATIARMRRGEPVAGMPEGKTFSENLPPRMIRRLKRLPKMTLSLAAAAYEHAKKMAVNGQKPGAVFMGTGWGALSETHDFLTRLKESKEKFPSPTDFVGSVHNGPASQVAIMFGATGPNITTSGGDYSFEQAVMAAELMLEDATQPALILGVEEGHDPLSRLLDPSIRPETVLADGGGALCVTRETEDGPCVLSIPFYQSGKAEGVIAALVDALGVRPNQPSGYALILAGIPAAMHREGKQQLAQFMALSQLAVPVVDYRKYIGEFASASAVATALAASFLDSGHIPGALAGGVDIAITSEKSKILLLGLGRQVTAIELCRP